MEAFNDIFNYIIELLTDDNIEFASIITSFFVKLENKDLHTWIKHGYDKGYQFYPMLVLYMLTDDSIESFDDILNILQNVFLLEPDNTDWSYFVEYLDSYYITDDPGILYVIIDSILNNINIKNVALLEALKIVVNNEVNFMKEEDYEEDTMEFKWFQEEIPAKINLKENKFETEKAERNLKIKSIWNVNQLTQFGDAGVDIGRVIKSYI